MSPSRRAPPATDGSLWPFAELGQDWAVPRADESLPTGWVTFLLTDIEGSTQAWQAAPGEMTALVSRHYEILERGIAAHGGVRPEEQGEGDSVVAVFTDAAAAVAAAVHTQLVLRSELPDLPVRMALHTGDAMLRNENNYVGLTIIRCARIRGCGHGGQILLSDETAGEIARTGPEAVGVVDLGLYGLRGLDGRSRIWQVTHPGLPAAFPPLKAGTSAAGNLPTPISSFVGRRADLAAVSRSLATSRLVTLTGEAGIGKSRLARAGADAAGNSFPGGVWWVGLGDVTGDDVTAVSTAIVRACALAGDVDPEQLIADHFGSVADSLLILDGHERAPIAVASVVEALLAGCPDARVLTTGRDPLGVPGEVVHAVPPLAVPAPDFDGDLADLAEVDATRLFIERVADHVVAVDPVGDAAMHIASICRDLHGVPLAIELAAARAGVTSVAELAASIDELAQHDVGSAGVTGTLASSIAWTYQFLPPEAQIALRRLAVFRGEFEIDAATAVAVGGRLDDAASANAIRTLFEQNLLSFDDEAARISMAPAIRAFAEERLAESDDVGGASARHGAWFAALAERFDDQTMPLSLLAPDETDVLAALEASMAGDDPSVALRILATLGAQWRHLGYPEIADRAAAWLCTRTPSDGEERWAAAVARLGLAQSGDPDAAIHLFADEALAIAELSGDERTVELLGSGAHHDAATTAGTVR